MQNPNLTGIFQGAFEQIAKVNPIISKAIQDELTSQRQTLKLIASENYCSPAVMLTMGNWLTDKYAEGISGARYYAKCEQVDIVETEATDQAKKLFNAEHAYVQPHSGVDANMVAYLSILHAKIQNPFLTNLQQKSPQDLAENDWLELRQQMGNQRLLAMDLNSGSHLTHGYKMNISSLLFEPHFYGVDPETLHLDYEQIRQVALKVKPLVILAGYSAYTHKINFAKFREIADEVNAVLMVDMAHFAGLVAGKVFTGEFDPIPYADIVTTTTHKTLRGPRGGMVLCKNWLKDYVNKGCPMVLGGPIPNMMAAKAVAFTEANQPEFRDYAHQIVNNSKALAQALIEEGVSIVRGGTENHIVIIDVFKTCGLTGRQAEFALTECSIITNRNSIPFDPNGVWYGSGIRIGTPALTTLGFKEAEMKTVAKLIAQVLFSTNPANSSDGKPSQAKYTLDQTTKSEVIEKIATLLQSHPLYLEIR